MSETMNEPCARCGHPRSTHTDLRAGGRLGCYRRPCSCSDFEASGPSEEVRS